MRNQIKALFTKSQSIHLDTASITFVVSSMVMTAGSAFAAAETTLPHSLYSMDGYPLIADSRTGDWEYDKRRSGDKSERRSDSHSREKTRDRRDNRIYEENRSKPRHQGQHQNRHQRNNPPVAVVPKQNRREHTDHRVTREYTTKPRHHTQSYPRFQRNQPPVVIYPRRHHHPRDRVVVRPFRYAYPRYRHHSHNDHIWGLFAFTAITLMILDNLNDQQQREHELALYEATTTPLGETIYWRDGNASGAVTPTREGTSNTGRYCREYQSEVTVGGKRETVYGTACQQADGSWEIEQ